MRKPVTRAPKSSREMMRNTIEESAMPIPERKRREALRKVGLRPIKIWVPDTSASDFAEECARQSHLLAGAPGEVEIEGFLEDALRNEGDRK